MTVDIEVRGLRETQAALARGLQALSGKGLEGLIAKATLRAHRYMTNIVHVRTGRLKNSLFPSVNGLVGTVRTNTYYAETEENRGGDHAFARRTVTEEGPGIAAMVEADVKAAL